MGGIAGIVVFMGLLGSGQLGTSVMSVLRIEQGPRLAVSYFLQIPSGAAIVIVATLLFAAAAVFSPKRRHCKVCGRER
jgi:hypothetical protein